MLSIRDLLQDVLFQVNLDFESEADMVEKMRIGIALQPVATALFANSPFRDGSDTGWYLPAKFNGLPFLHTWHLGSSVNPDRPTYLPSNLKLYVE